ncbi:MAG: hypothetical protein SAK29_41305 [Scytonema sp. PMC 1069.18]|nr:hypothetical protein [Scytonema sp. PMC 1069.18]MEC4881664.1 hypothetical protein [Scytonema sp. PMC 1070.18]
MVRDSYVDSGCGDFPKQLHSTKFTVSGRKGAMLFTGLMMSWMVLNFMWRTKQIRVKTMFFWMVLAIILGISISWNPLALQIAQ